MKALNILGAMLGMMVGVILVAAWLTWAVAPVCIVTTGGGFYTPCPSFLNNSWEYCNVSGENVTLHLENGTIVHCVDDPFDCPWVPQAWPPQETATYYCIGPGWKGL
jgi:hypothetical protein